MGPNTVTGHHSVIYTSECAINFTIRIARIVLTSHADSVEIRPAVQNQENEWIQRKLRGLIWTKDEGGWYVDRETGRNHLVYPSFMTHYWLRTVWPGWRGFEVRGGRRWGRFYVGLFSGKVRRNKWILAVIVVVFGWYLGETRVDIS
jgi:hypothetical protein